MLGCSFHASVLLRLCAFVVEALVRSLDRGFPQQWLSEVGRDSCVRGEVRFSLAVNMSGVVDARALARLLAVLTTTTVLSMTTVLAVEASTPSLKLWRLLKVLLNGPSVV